MDFEFTYDEYRQPVARFSLGHEALGRWFSQELCSSRRRIEDLLDIIQQFEINRCGNHQILGSEFQLVVNHDEIEVIALALDFDPDGELPEDTSLYNEESYAECGLQDFKQALLSWQAFVGL